MASLKLVCLALVVGLVVAAPLAESDVNCGQMANMMVPCLAYLRPGRPIPLTCCSGIRSLDSAARTTSDRRTTCQCLKATCGRIRGLNLGLVSALPGKCGVNLPYKISPSTVCSSVR